MQRYKGFWRRHSLGDAPQRETESTPGRVLRCHSTSLSSGAGRLARLSLLGCLLVILTGGAPLLRPSAVHAAQAAPTLGRAAPLSSRQHDGDGWGTCSVAWFTCDQSQQQQACIEPAPVVHVVQVPVVRVVKVVQVVQEVKVVKVFVPVEKKVFVPVPVEKVVKVFVSVSAMPTPTPTVDASIYPPIDPMF